MSVIGSSLTNREKELILISWESLSLNYSSMASTFYQKLFALDPTIKLLFKNDISIQEIKFMDSLHYLLKRMTNLEGSTKKMKKLGLKHKGFGAKAKHYSTFWDALLYSFEVYLKDEFTDEVQTSWEKLFESVVETMILGAKRK